jgi:CDGSH-type Zn-finger protein
VSCEEVVIVPYRDGPYLVRGPVVLRDQDGREIVLSRRTIALCRCGRSRLRPFCDGTHQLTRFRAPSAPEDRLGTPDEPQRDAASEPNGNGNAAFALDHAALRGTRDALRAAQRRLAVLLLTVAPRSAAADPLHEAQPLIDSALLLCERGRSDGASARAGALYLVMGALHALSSPPNTAGAGIRELICELSEVVGNLRPEVA